MKRFFLLCVVLVIICVPAIVLGESWVNFVDRAHEAMAGAKGEVIVEVGGQITGMNDTLLIVPKNVQLVIEGEGTHFGGMRLGGGDVTLRGEGMTVGNMNTNHPVILSNDPQSKKPYQLTLTLEKGVTCNGIRDGGFRERGGAAEIEIINYGKILSGGIFLDIYTHLRGDRSLALYNYGEIESETFSLWVGYSDGARVTVHNEGVMRIIGRRYEGIKLLASTTKNGGVVKLQLSNSGSIITNCPITIDARPYFSGNVRCELSIENLEGGIIESTVEGEAALQLAYPSEKKTTKGFCKFDNAGTLLTAGPLLAVYFSTENQIPASFVNTGVVEWGDLDTAPVQIEMLHHVGDINKIMTEGKFQDYADKWIKKTVFDFLPDDTEIDIVLLGSTNIPYPKYFYGKEDYVIVAEQTILHPGE